jgi:hypothetical protein
MKGGKQMYDSPEAAQKRWEKTENGKAYKAKKLRHKKAALELLNLDDITNMLYEIGSECEEIYYFMADDETLLDALDGDEEEAYEFRMVFSDLSAKCDSLSEAINDGVTRHFDDFMVGLLGNRYKAVGYDGYEEDYFGLTSYDGGRAQEESGKRVMRLNKEEILSVCGQCLGVVISFLDVRHSYDYLKATFDILKEKNTSVLRQIKAIEELYEKAAEEDFQGENGRLFGLYADGLPDEVWLSA